MLGVAIVTAHPGLKKPRYTSAYICQKTLTQSSRLKSLGHYAVLTVKQLPAFLRHYNPLKNK